MARANLSVFFSGLFKSSPSCGVTGFEEIRVVKRGEQEVEGWGPATDAFRRVSQPRCVSRPRPPSCVSPERSVEILHQLLMERVRREKGSEVRPRITNVIPERDRPLVHEIHDLEKPSRRPLGSRDQIGAVG